MPGAEGKARLMGPTRPMGPKEGDIAGFRRALVRSLPEAQVRDDPETLAAHSRDESGASAMPDLVVEAQSHDDVACVLRHANEFGVPITPRGLGSGKSGGAVPIVGGAVLSLAPMRSILRISPEDMCVVTEPGAITGDLMAAVEAEDLFYPPDPNSLSMCTIGGNVACNAGGPRALKYGTTKAYVLALRAVLADGRSVRVGRGTLKHATGYDLVGLLVGSEGTLAVITEITCRLIPRPRAVETALVCFPSAADASHAISRVFASGVTPRTLELLDRHALDALRSERPGGTPALPPGLVPREAGAALILETDAQEPAAAFEALQQAADVCADTGAIDAHLARSAQQRESIWAPRRLLSVALSETAEAKISEDIVVPRGQIPAMLDRADALAERHRLRVATYGHAGDGNLHINILFAESERGRAEKAVVDVLKAAIELGGTISGEHGIGSLKRDFLPLEHSAVQLEMQQKIKQSLDPRGILNPGKVLPGGGPWPS